MANNLDNPSLNSEVKKKKRSLGEKVMSIILIVAVVLLVVVIVFRWFLFVRIEVRQTSMTPTYTDGQKIWVHKNKSVERGKVAVFYEDTQPAIGFPDLFGKHKKLIKRVVGVEDDKIWISDYRKEYDNRGNLIGEFYTLRIMTSDGRIILEKDNPYLKPNGETINYIEYDMKVSSYDAFVKSTLLATTEENPFVVPAGKIFVLGDNRANSSDSRNFGVVDCSQVIGVCK